jgi:hypothetical protein
MKYYPCWLCGKTALTYEIRFDAGAVEPTVGETLTGGTSLDTGVVMTVALESGSYAGSDAVGTIELSGVTGAIADDQLTAFQDNETVSGSTGGAGMLTTNGTALRKLSGRLFPESELAYRDGHYWCRDHYEHKFRIEDRAEDARADKIMEDND